MRQTLVIMCLLIALFRVHDDAPLIVAANRDEVLARPTEAMTELGVLGEGVRGGRDLLAGGTWLAVNRHGVVAGLTNVPGLRDPARRSRGELPLVATKEKTAAAASSSLAALPAADFNPCWMLVGDARALFSVDMAAGGVVRELPPGLHVLENRPLGAPSPKVDHVRAALRDVENERGPALLARLQEVLRDHAIPTTEQDGGRALGTEACCVHTELRVPGIEEAIPYGTRSSTITLIRESGPELHVARGPSCTHSFERVSF